MPEKSRERNERHLSPLTEVKSIFYFSRLGLNASDFVRFFVGLFTGRVQGGSSSPVYICEVSAWLESVVEKVNTMSA